MLNEHKYYLYKKDLTCFCIDGAKEITLNELFDLIKDAILFVAISFSSFERILLSGSSFFLMIS